MAAEQDGEASVHQDVSPGRDAYFAGRDQHMHQTQVTFQVQAGRRVGRVDTNLRRRFSRYRDTYLQALIAACNSASGAPSAGARLSRVERASTANLSSIRAPLPDVVADKPSPDGETILRLLTRTSRQSRVLILGGFGMGKTTQAQSVVRTLAHTRRRGATLPVHVRIDAEAVELIKAAGSLAELARHTTPAMVAKEPPGWLEGQLARGRSTVVVDDTLEVAEQDRSGISKWLRKQFASYPDTSFLVTSGPSGEDDLRPGCTECLEILPLTIDQVENWQENADTTFRSWLPTVPGLWAFAGNPRFLEVMIRRDAESRASDGRGPRHNDFLAAVCGVLLTGTRQAIPDITAEAWQAVLGELAHHVCVKRDLRIAEEDAARTASGVLATFGCDVIAEDFVRVLARFGMLQQGDVDGNVSFRFAHPVVQDFFAASYLVSSKPDDARLAELAGDPWWSQPLRLLAERGERVRVIKACIRRDHPPGACLALARDCLADYQGKLAGPLKSLADEAARQIGGTSRQSQVADLLGRLNDTAALVEHSQILRRPLTNADFQLFADAAGESGKRYFLDHWNGERFPPGTGDEMATGIRRGDLTLLCDWLTRRDGRYWRYRMPDQAEIRSAGGLPEAVDAPDCRFWVQDGDSARCLELPSAQVSDHLRRQMEMDILRDLSPSMRRLISPEIWQRLRSAVRQTSERPLWGLDQYTEKELDLDVPAEALAGLGVILAGHHDPGIADEVAARLELKEHHLSAVRHVLAAILESQHDAENIDPDTVLNVAAWQNQAVVSLSRAYSYIPRYLDRDTGDHAAIRRLRWLASTTLHAAEGAVKCPREQDMPWSSVKVLRWCARVAALLFAIEAARLAADTDALSAISHRLDMTPYEVLAEPAALASYADELSIVGASIYTGLALVDVRSYSGLSRLGGAVRLVREPVYDTFHGEEVVP
jgi:NACHT domain